MDKHHHDHHDSGFFGGFLLGAIIGAAVVFFLFTEKGKKLLKTITEEGFEGFSDFKDLIQEEMDSYEDEEYGDMAEEEQRYLASIPHTAGHSHVEPLHHDHHDHQEERHHHDHEDDGYSHYESAPAPSRVKRFFRGVKR